MPSDKRQLYEFDVRVPLMIRGPNVTPGRVVKVILYSLLTLNPNHPIYMSTCILEVLGSYFWKLVDLLFTKDQ